MTRTFTLLFLLYFLLPPMADAQSPAHEPGDFLVSLREGVTAEFFAQKIQSYEAWVLPPKVEKVSTLLNICRIRSKAPEQATLAWLSRQPEVRCVQFNHTLENREDSPSNSLQIQKSQQEETLPNDPLFPQQWHLLNEGQSGGVANADLDAELAWDIATGGTTPAGDTIVLAVIDGGLRYNHADLAANRWYNWAEIPNNGIDDDQNGFADDFRGWNAFAQNDDIQGNNTEHGTPVSAILGARGNNGTGVTGVNWHTKIMFVSTAGTEAEVLAAYDYVLQARKRYNATWGASGAFVVAVNCSLGINYGQPGEHPLWCAAFDSLGAAGIVSIAATANIPVNVDEVGDIPTACPSNYLISVTSLNKSDQKAGGAAWGATHVDLGAYGQDVLTATGDGGYGYVSGTSFAAPQVTGAIGLLYAADCPNLIALAKTDPAAAAYWAKSLVLENVNANASLANKTATGGRLNLFKTLQAYEGQCSDCSPPFALKVEDVNEETAHLLWTGTPAFFSVKLRWRRLGVGAWHVVENLENTYWLTTLSACTEYEFEVQAFCGKGLESAWSPPFVFSTTGCCTAPASIWLEDAGEHFAKIAWPASAYDNGYRLRLRAEGGPSWTILECNTNAIELENLDACTQYETQVQARCEESFTVFSDLFSFKTKGCGACNEVPYCLPSGVQALEEWIVSVGIGGWVHLSGLGGNGYQNFTNEQILMPQMHTQSLLPVSIVPGFFGIGSKEYYRIFVDFNQDGDFEDAGELAFDPGFALEGIAEGMLTVPALATAGITRLRVMMKFTNPNDPPPSPCSPFDFGQVEDYCAELITDPINPSTTAEDTLAHLRAYPLPARDYVMLEFPEGTKKEEWDVSVFDLTGRKIAETNAIPHRKGLIQLDTRPWPAGLYLVEARCDGKVLRAKVVKD